MIVFSDMDGTLLTSDKQMSDATWAMLDELARHGVEFVPCTGRPLSGIFEPILAHPAVHYAVCANGASVWQLDDGTPTDISRATRILLASSWMMLSSHSSICLRSWLRLSVVWVSVRITNKLRM